MKKLSLLVAGLMMFGFSYAGEGKACCKKDEKCKKEASAKCDKKGEGKKACCKDKKDNAGQERAENVRPEPAAK